MWSQWYLIKEKNTGGVAIKRYRKLNGQTRWQRYPAKLYKQLEADQVESLLRRINASQLAAKWSKEQYSFNHSFVNQKLIEAFEEHIAKDISSVNRQKEVIRYLMKYVFVFFVVEQKLPNPSLWKQKEAEFAEWLFKKKKLALGTYRHVVQTANRYIAFLHERHPAEVPEVVLRPIGRKKMKVIAAKEAKADHYRFIPPEQFAELIKLVKPKLQPAFNLSYCFGLRCAEVLGLRPDDVMVDALDIKRQLATYNKLGSTTRPLKDLDSRSVPYWFATAEEAYGWIAKLKLMHPNSLSRAVTAEMTRLGYQFEHHDFRRSFVTRALNAGYSPITVSDACGHEDLSTTMGYYQKIKESNRQRWQPTGELTRT